MGTSPDVNGSVAAPGHRSAFTARLDLTLKILLTLSILGSIASLLLIANGALLSSPFSETVRYTVATYLSLGLSILSFSLTMLAIRQTRIQTSQEKLILNLLDEIGNDNVLARTEIVSNGELGTIAQKLNDFLDVIMVQIESKAELDSSQETLVKLLVDLSSFRQGDLTVTPAVTEDTNGAIAFTFNSMAKQFSNVVVQAREMTRLTQATAEKLSTQSNNLIDSNLQQAKTVSTLIDSSKSFQAAQENCRILEESVEISDRAESTVTAALQTGDEIRLTLEELEKAMKNTTKIVKSFEKNSENIQNSAAIMEDFADRTSILALNASIQTTMAGDSGHGFTEIADEIQRLSGISGNAAKEIGIAVKDFKTDLDDLSSCVSGGVDNVDLMVAKAFDSHRDLQALIEVTGQLNTLFRSVKKSAEQQEKRLLTLSDSLTSIGEVSRQSALVGNESANAMDSLSTSAQQLRKCVADYKILEKNSTESTPAQ
ncbi:MAG: methyl-accepting chemotaxis protein [Desulfobulbaceae bacterium]|nr:methyl-accepting chemotaxis protein [Desulfobulbaceae bacterium]